MKLILLSLAAMVLLVGCASRSNDVAMEHFGRHRVFVCYDNEVNGYKATMMLLPRANERDCLGRALLDLEKEDVHYQFYIDALNLPWVDIPEKPQSDTVIHLEYPAGEPNKQDTLRLSNLPQAPFCFLDVDFDGVDELLLAHWKQGYRGAVQYEAFEMVWDGESVRTCNIPYCLDDNTEIDYKNLTVVNLSWISGDRQDNEVYQYAKVVDESGDTSVVLKDSYTEQYRFNLEGDTIEHNIIPREKSVIIK